MKPIPNREQGPFGIAVAELSAGGVVTLRGSGAVIAPGLVLTAWHVVEGKKNLVVLRGGVGEPIPVVEVLPKEKPTHDVALLRVKAERLPTAQWLDRAIDADLKFEADGYPKVQNHQPSTSLEQVGGVTRAAGVCDGTLNLDVVGPPVWNGLSGAAVRIGGVVVAVVSEAREDWSPGSAGTKRITATPLAIVWPIEKWFRDALADRKAVEEEYDARRAEVRARIADTLKGEEALRAALLADLGGSADALPDALLDASGHRAAVALHKALDRMEARRQKLSDPVRFGDLWTELLPLMADLRHLALDVAEALKRGQRELVLPWREESLAEVVIAAAERRACSLVEHPSRTEALWGKQFRLLPRVLQDGALRYSKKNLEDTVRQEMQTLESELMGPLGAADRDRLNESLEYQSEVNLTVRLVLVDADLGDLADDIWEVTCSARLPGLHLLRMRGGEAPTEVKQGALQSAVQRFHKATRS